MHFHVPVVSAAALVAMAVSGALGAAFEIHESAKLVAPSPQSGDEFGFAVAVEDGTALVGARFDEDGTASTGLVHVFNKVGGAWVWRSSLKASDAAADDRFGGAVALKGDYAIIGAPRNNDAGTWSGSAYLIYDNGTTWAQQKKVTAGDAASFDQFGIAVGIDGDYAVIGSLGDDDGGSQSGSAYIFMRAGTNWTQQKKLRAADEAANDRFGAAVSMLGDRVLIGAPGDETGRGSAYVFVRTGTNWAQEGKLVASDAAANDLAGTAVVLFSDRAVVGAPGDDGGKGAAYVFKRVGSTWTQVVKITASDGVAGANFGAAIAGWGDMVAVGASGAGGGRGTGYVFELAGSTFSETAKLTSLAGAAGDALGAGISMDGESVLAGAFGVSSSAGAAYVFGTGIPDCDTNGVPDACDLDCLAVNPESGLACWIDYPAPVCGALEDCNANDIPDICEADCNTNGVADECDVTEGISLDCDTNGVPDECQPDCNDNGVADVCEVSDGDSADCNSNGVPDECELYSATTFWAADFAGGLPAGWSASGLWHVTDACARSEPCDPSPWAYFGLDTSCTFDTGAVVEGALTAPELLIPSGAGRATLRYCSIYHGDRGSAPHGFDAAWVSVNGVIVDDVAPTSSAVAWQTRDVDLSAYAGQTVTIAWHFDSADDAFNDKLGWQIDGIELIVDNDCNASGTMDACDIAAGVSADCDSNGFPDDCAIAEGLESDCNSNGVPDTCELDTDCNTNGVPDICEVNVIYVDAGATAGLEDGTSWSDAFTDLNAALEHTTASCLPSELWVASGVYAPAYFDGPRTATFQLRNSVALYGGFDGTETKRAQRNPNPKTNGAYLSGDIERDDIGSSGTGNNCYHVVTGSGTDATAVLDGFVITSGAANSAAPNDRGAGMYLDAGHPTVSNCVIQRNLGGAGAVFVKQSKPAFTRCTFIGNLTSFGGAVYLVTDSTPSFVNCEFVGNAAALVGGAAYVSAGSDPKFINCVFTGNLAGGDGGALYVQSSSEPVLVNCTLSGNTSASRGGGIAARSTSDVTVSNSILWGNRDAVGGGETAQIRLDSAFVDLAYSCVEGLTGGLGGAGNIGGNPLLADAAGPDQAAGTLDDNLRLLPDSPCVDAGDNGATHSVAVGVDLDGLPRFTDDPLTPDTGVGSGPIVDMGAYEGQVDCNANGVADALDISSGGSADCDDDGLPDECQIGVDGGAIGGPFFCVADCDPDCNANGIPDACDIAGAVSADCTGNGIPDECEPDCDGDGLADICAIDAGVSADCDENGVPDACEMSARDCDGDGVLDACELFKSLVATSGRLSPVTGGSPLSFTMSAPPLAISDVIVALAAVADLSDPSEQLAVSVNGTALGTVFVTGARDCPATPDLGTIVVSANLFNAAVGAGDATVRVIASPSVDGICAESYVEVTITYLAFEDCNTNGLLDACEPDCNANGAPDECDITAGVSLDCNTNGVPDTCDLVGGTSADWDGDGLPDDCELDCNDNGIPDECDLSCAGPCGGIAGCGQSDDINANDVPDECDPDCNDNGRPDDYDIATGASEDTDGNGVPDECEDCNDNGYVDGVEIAAGTSPDCNTNGIPDACDIASGVSEDCDANGVPDECDVAGGAADDCNTNGVPDACDLAAGVGADCDVSGVLDACEPDGDGDGAIDACDDCPSDPAKVVVGLCGCGMSDVVDGDGDGVVDCVDDCPDTPAGEAVDADGCSSGGCCFELGFCAIREPSTCAFFGGVYLGSGTTCALDSDGDSFTDCGDECPSDPFKSVAGDCGCGVSDADTDADGVADCLDLCPGTGVGDGVDWDGCPLHGACCTPTGSGCVDFAFVDAAYCALISGVYQGNGSNCDMGCAMGTAGDFDGDGVLDLDDYDAMGPCLSGPREGEAYVPPPVQCRAVFDFDGDDDVDLADFAVFQGAFGQ